MKRFGSKLDIFCFKKSQTGFKLHLSLSVVPQKASLCEVIMQMAVLPLSPGNNGGANCEVRCGGKKSGGGGFADVLLAGEVAAAPSTSGLKPLLQQREAPSLS